MKNLLTMFLLFLFSGAVMSGNVTLINETIFDAKFKFLVDDFATSQSFDVAANTSLPVSLKEYLTSKPQKNYVRIHAVFPFYDETFEVHCYPDFTVENFLKNNGFTITVDGSIFPFTQCSILTYSSA